VSANRKEAYSGVLVVPSERLGLEPCPGRWQGDKHGRTSPRQLPGAKWLHRYHRGLRRFRYALNRLGKTIARALREQQGSGASIRTPFEGTPWDSAATPRLMFGACGPSY
jgi:hypothetical protein